MSELDPRILEALFGSIGNLNPVELAKMLKGQTMSFKASFEEIPLDIDLKFKEGEILVRVRYKTEEDKSEDGDQPESG